MAESSLAIAFTELGEGMKTIAVHGPTLWESGKARLVPDDDESAVRLVSCGPKFPEHDVAVFAPEDATSATPLADDVVAKMTRAQYGVKLSTEYMQPILDTAAKYGILKAPVDAKDLIFPGL